MVRDVILCFVGLIVSPLLTGVECSIVRLTAVPPVVAENGSLDLNCFLTENTNTRNSSRFYVDGNGLVHVALLQNGSCVVIDAMNIALNHVCVNSNNFTITLGNVSRLLHGKTCRCTLFPSGMEVASYDITINVSVPVGGVEIMNVSKTIVSMAANHWKTFECKTLPARPVATVKWTIKDTIISSYNTTVEQTSDDLTVVTSIMSLFPDKSMNGQNLTCSANNYMDISYDDWVILNVTYPPDRPVSIEGLQNGQTVSIIENIGISLNCTIGESNPPASLIWSCTDVTVFNVSGWNYTAKLLQIQASRNKKPVCSCTSTYRSENPEKAEASFNVLYPATISKLFSGGLNISKQQLNVIENDTVHVRCDADGNPSPTFRWTLQNEHYSYSQTITLDHVKRNNATTRYSCIASNVMNDSTGSGYQGNDTTDFTLVVLYPPRIHDLPNLSIIEGNSSYFNCTINPGNPSVPTDIRWVNLSGKQSVLNFNKVNRADSGIYTCVANNTINTSYGDIQFGIDNKTIGLQVLYPPENITIDSTTAPNHQVIDNIILIENTSLELICSAQGNPMPSFYSWSGLATSDSPKVYVHTSKSNRGGNITCLAQNVMTELPQNNTFSGTIKKTLLVDVLYPPEVNLTDRNVIEGEDVNISCVHTPGKITHQSIRWTSHHTIITNNNNLIIRNVTRQHAGNCTCMVDYTMIPTYGESQSGIIIGVTYINAFYKAELTNFFVVQYNQTKSVTVNEHDSVHMICILDSNPSSTIKIDVRNQTVSSGKLTKTLEHSISQISCNDTGVYRCSGYNFLNIYISLREIKLFVNCSPRRLSSVHAIQNVTASLHDLATLKCYALAYPIPVFKWWRLTNSILTEANNGYAKIHNTSENEFQIEYIITNMNASDIGEYVLTINNTFGHHQESFFLFQKDTTSAEQNQSQTGLAGPLAGGIIGSIIGIVAIVGAVFLLRTRLHGKQLNTTNNSCNLSLSHVYHNELKDSDCTVTGDGGIPHVYEELQNIGSDLQYQQLTLVSKDNKGSDQQYQQLTVALTGNEGQRMIYENLRIKSNNDLPHEENEHEEH